MVSYYDRNFKALFTAIPAPAIIVFMFFGITSLISLVKGFRFAYSYGMCAKRKTSSETENGANPARLREEARRKLKREMEVSKTKIIILFLLAFILIDGGAIGYIWYKKHKMNEIEVESSEDGMDDEPGVVTSYSTVGPINNQEYLALLQSEVESAKGGLAKVNATVNLFRQYINMKDFDLAKETLEEIKEKNLKTDEEKLLYYQACAELYSENILNDSELFQKCKQNANEAASRIYPESYSEEDDVLFISDDSSENIDDEYYGREYDGRDDYKLELEHGGIIGENVEEHE